MIGKYWLIGQPYESGVVYRQVTDMSFTYVIGMDVGFAETLVSLRYVQKYLDENGKERIRLVVRRLELNKEEHKKIPSLLAFRENGTVVIGADAAKYPDFIQAFKVSPDLWNKPFCGVTAQSDQKLTYGKLMEIYIRELWKEVLKQEPCLKKELEENKVLITVGCPASPLWTDWKSVMDYSSLLTRATGCANTAVLPESTAAIMSVVLDANELEENDDREINEAMTVELSGGIAVIDAGSSTIDFTYVLLGRKLITCSLNVAGYSFDEAMLDQILDDNKYSKEDIPPDQLRKLLVELRQIKEAFYPDQISLGPKPLNICLEDENGAKTVKTLQFDADKIFMDKVMNRKIDSSHLEEGVSWLERCRKFIQDSSVLINRDPNGRLLCDRVVLTGGTSYIPAFRQAAEEVYTREKVSGSRNRSASVSRGLCYAKGLEIEACQQVTAYQTTVSGLSKQYYKHFLNNLAEYLSDELCSNAREVIAPMLVDKRSITVGRFIDRLNIRIYQNPRLTGRECQEKVESLFFESFEQCRQEMCEIVNGMSGMLYGTSLTRTPELPSLTASEMEEVLNKMNISKVIESIWTTVLADCFHITSLSMTVTLLATLLGKTPYRFLSLPLTGLAALIKSKGGQAVRQFVISHKTRLSHQMLTRIYRSVCEKDMAEQTLKDALKILGDKKVMECVFINSVTEQAEVLLGKVLFLVYDQKPTVL